MDTNNNPTTYRVFLTFTADRPITETEMAYLLTTLGVQVEEPWTLSDDGEWSQATFRTWDISTEVTTIVVPI